MPKKALNITNGDAFNEHFLSERGGAAVPFCESMMDGDTVADIYSAEFIQLRAAALGVDAVLVTPTCCDPLCRRAVRVSMGTIFQVPWTRIGDEHTDWPHPSIDRLRALGFKTAAMALSDDSVSIDHPALANEPKLAIILGTEGDGLADSTIADCDYTVRIPMAHGVDSLNVAAASAVAFFQLGIE